MTFTIDSYTLNVTDFSESSQPTASEWDAWENEALALKRFVYGLKRVWSLSCVEKDVAWANSAALYLRNKAQTGEVVSFTVDEGDRYLLSSTSAYVDNVNVDFENPNLRRFTVQLSEKTSFSPVRDNSCVLYLPLDEGAGSVTYDKSVYGNNGTLYNGVAWADGKYGKALSFDGVDDQVVVPYASNLELATFSVLFWAKVTDLSAARCVIGNRDLGCTFDLKFQSNGLHSDIGDGTTWLTTSADYYFTPELNRWYHVVYVVTSGGDCKIYLDGTYKNTVTFTGTPKFVRLGGNVRVGQYGGGTEWFKGTIDEVRIYNRALTAGEILQLYLSGLTRINELTLPASSFSKTVSPVKSDWPAWENQTFTTERFSYGGKRVWQFDFTEKDVPFSYSSLKNLQYLISTGETCKFAVRGSALYSLDEIDAYVLNCQVSVKLVGGQNIRYFTVQLKEA